MHKSISKFFSALILAIFVAGNLYCSGTLPPPGTDLYLDINKGITNNEPHKDDPVAKKYFDKMCKKIKHYWHPMKGYHQKPVVSFMLMLDGSISWLQNAISYDGLAVQAINKSAPFGPAPNNLGSTKVIWYYITLAF